RPPPPPAPWATAPGTVPGSGGRPRPAAPASAARRPVTGARDALPSPDCGTPPRIYQEAPAGLPGVADAARPEGPAGGSGPGAASRRDPQGMVGRPPAEVGQLRGAGGAGGHQQPAGFLDALADPFGDASREIVMLPLVAE